MYQTFAQMMAALAPTTDGPSVCTMALPHGGRFRVMRNATSLNRTPATAPAVAPKPAAATPTASPAQLSELRKAWQQVKREEMELSTKPASPQPAAAPVAKGGFASRIRFNGSFNAFKKKAAAPAA